MGFWRQEYCSELPFPTPGDHILAELFTMTHQACMALHDMAHSFIELHKPLHHDIVAIHEGGNVKDRGVCRASVHGVSKN